MPQSPEQPDFFERLDGENPVGVFYFPPTATDQASQVASLTTTIRRIEFIEALLDDTKIKGKFAAATAECQRWLAQLRFAFQKEANKLRQLVEAHSVMAEAQINGSINGDPAESARG